MKFTKNIMGITATLTLLILLTQSRFFDFLTETPLGRMILLAFIIFISYTNQILGLLAVLVIIIAFSQYDMNIYEGLKIKNIVKQAQNQAEAAAKKKQEEEEEDKISRDQVKILELEKKIMETKLENLEKEKAQAESEASVAKAQAKPVSKEGFCMAEKELTMLRGKQSNSIPVFNKSREQEDNVSPSDKSVFNNLFSEF